MLICDMYLEKNNIIDKKYRSQNWWEHKFKHCDSGDKLIIVPSNCFINFECNDFNYKDELIMDIDIFLMDCLYKKTNYLDDVVINHKYLKGGITDNNIANKLKTYKYKKFILEKRIKNIKLF